MNLESALRQELIADLRCGPGSGTKYSTVKVEVLRGGVKEESVVLKSRIHTSRDLVVIPVGMRFCLCRRSGGVQRMGAAA